MRQRCQFRRQAEVGEGLLDMRLPLRGTFEALAETIRLAELETHVVRGFRETLRRAGGTEGRGDALLLVIEIVVAGGQVPQHLLDLFALLVHCVAPLAQLHVAVEMQRAVHDAQVVLVVQEPFAGGDLGIDADPEVHFLLEFGRHGDALFGGAGHACGQRQRNAQQYTGKNVGKTNGASPAGTCGSGRI